LITIFGQAIPETTAELLREPCVLLVWDMQEGIARRAHGAERVIENVAALCAAARRVSVPIAYAQHCSYSMRQAFEDRVWLRDQYRRQQMGEAGAPDARYSPGADAWCILPEVAPHAEDVVIPKTRQSLFFGTATETLLRTLGRDVIILTGVATDRGIITTAREAKVRGIFPVVVSDGVAAFSSEQHEQAIREIDETFDTCTTADVLATWQITS
jgi:nicotinamidase-related amidase